MEVKVFARILADILGISSVVLGWITNLDNIKSSILFIVGVIYLMVRIFFFIKRQMNGLRKEQQEFEMRELKMKEQQIMMKEKEIEALEKELSIRVTGLTPEQRKNKK